MKILLDSANLKMIEELLPFYPIDGVTTNPTILAKESDNIKDTLLAIRKLIGKDRALHVQVTAKKSEEIVQQAITLKKFLGDNFYVKIPVTEQGLKAVPVCKAAGVKVTVTAVFKPMQALMAGLAGADFVAPYVDRLDNINANGVEIVKQIAELFKAHNLKTQVLAASFKNVQQVYDVAASGTHAVTINGELCRKLLFHPYTDKSLDDFETDWKCKFGDAEITDLIK